MSKSAAKGDVAASPQELLIGHVEAAVARFGGAVVAVVPRDGTRQALAGAFSHMVVHPDLVSQVGPAVNSGKSFLIYGQPGNGKTYLVEALFQLESPEIYVPYALEWIRVFGSSDGIAS